MQRLPAPPPLSGLRVVERSRTRGGRLCRPAARHDGRQVILLEPPGGTPLRREPPFLPGERRQRAVRLSRGGQAQRRLRPRHGRRPRGCSTACSSEADILIDDTPLAERAALASISGRSPRAFPTWCTSRSCRSARTGPRPAGTARRSTSCTPPAKATCCRTACRSSCSPIGRR